MYYPPNYVAVDQVMEQLSNQLLLFCPSLSWSVLTQDTEPLITSDVLKTVCC